MLVEPHHPKYAQAFARLLSIMNDLREQCPWDKQQTMESLRHLTIEETYELSDAILQNNLEEVKKELGDLLLHIVFYARIAAEQNAFDIADVLQQVCEKLIRRHPHIYGNLQVADEQEVKRNWEQLKMAENKASGKPVSVLSGVPQSLPALIKAIRIQEKARAIGFDWNHPQEVWAKVEEEMNELKNELQQGNGANREKIENEFGDLLFALVNYARFINVNPESALEKTNLKFIRRFHFLETESQKDGKSLADMTLAEMDVYWNRAKALGL
ncbi:MAG: nucleoside triphosphate pyrophosphohydrolase [Cytophagales bacterium]|nr:nucleoside triphosphate pyrophosphohydrolase [Bernardetiaceae bacterium]MDW8205944.1 nucleoside triphosphate pyrophosphohydrolase [Cytophagales bacterium]